MKCKPCRVTVDGQRYEVSADGTVRPVYRNLPADLQLGDAVSPELAKQDQGRGGTAAPEQKRAGARLLARTSGLPCGGVLHREGEGGGEMKRVTTRETALQFVLSVATTLQNGGELTIDDWSDIADDLDAVKRYASGKVDELAREEDAR